MGLMQALMNEQHSWETGAGVRGRKAGTGAFNPSVAGPWDGLNPQRMPPVQRCSPESVSCAAQTFTTSAPAEIAGTAIKLTFEQDALILEHLPVVRQVARALYEKLPRHLELEDLVSAGMLGLVDAAARFRPERNVQFRSYAQFRVRGAILDSLRSLDWGPRALRRRGRELKEATAALQNRLGRNPSDSEVAESMGIRLEELQHLSGELKALEITSLHAARGEDSSDEELQFLPANEDSSPLVQILQGESRANLLDALERLSERERLVMTLYYFEELTMKQIGVSLGLVESRISQIHRGGLLRLRGLLVGLKQGSKSSRGRLSTT